MFSTLGDFLQVEKRRILRSNAFASSSVSNWEKLLRRLFRRCNRPMKRTVWAVHNVTSGTSVSNRADSPSKTTPILDGLPRQWTTITYTWAYCQVDSCQHLARRQIFRKKAYISNISVSGRWRNTAVGWYTEASSAVIHVIHRTAVRRGYDGGLPCYFRIQVQPNCFRAFRLNEVVAQITYWLFCSGVPWESAVNLSPVDYRCTEITQPKLWPTSARNFTEARVQTTEV